MYRLQAKVAKLVLALAVVASGAELSNASDEVQGLFVRESNASTVCGVGSAVGVRGCARVAVLITAGFHNIMHGARFDGKLINASQPLLAAWLRTTAASLRRHVVEPNAGDVFIYSWNPGLVIVLPPAPRRAGTGSAAARALARRGPRGGSSGRVSSRR